MIDLTLIIPAKNESESLPIVLESLKNISSKEYLDNFISENISQIENINSHIYSDF